MLDWHGTGMSVMEMSHRGKEFISIAERPRADLRELLAVPANYKVLFMQGGATVQFAVVPLNLSAPDNSADYVNTGAWSKKAIGEAKQYAKVNVAADAGEPYCVDSRPSTTWKLDPTRRICTTRRTRRSAASSSTAMPDVGGVPLVADMSSTILSRPLDVSRSSA